MSVPPTPSPPSAPSAVPVVILRGLRLQCVIGVEPAEAVARQQVVLDLRILPLSGPKGAVPGADYAAVAARLRRMAETERFLLLEDFAAHVAEILLGEFPVAEATIRCAKPKVLPDLDEAAVEIQRKTKKRK